MHYSHSTSPSVFKLTVDTHYATTLHRKRKALAPSIRPCELATLVIAIATCGMVLYILVTGIPCLKPSGETEDSPAPHFVGGILLDGEPAEPIKTAMISSMNTDLCIPYKTY